MTFSIGVIYICTGRYSRFWRRFYESVERNFLPLHVKQYFIFTDDKNLHPLNDRCHVIPQMKLGWPNDTLKRYHIICGASTLLNRTDYLFFMNANLIIEKLVGDEILPGPEDNYLMGTQHPGFYDKAPEEFTFEINPHSTAYIPICQGSIYYMGGFNGGRTAEFLSMSNVLRDQIQTDLHNNIVAVWHDESHLNAYFSKIKPLTLTPAYGYPEGWDIPFDRKILILDKSKFGGHEYLRGNEKIHSPSINSIRTRIMSAMKLLRNVHGHR